MAEKTAKERQEARQEAARKRTRELVGKAEDFLTHVYDDVKIGGNVDQAYKSAFDWLMDNQDMDLKEFSDGIDSFLRNNIDKPIEEFFASTGKKILKQFERDESGRFGWETSLNKAFKDFGASFLERVRDRDLGPDIAASAAEFENELDTRINNLQGLINSATPDEVSELPAWQLELDTLRGRLLTMPDSDDSKELAAWMAGSETMPDGLRVTDTFSVRGEEKQILENAIDDVESRPSQYESPEVLSARLKKEGEDAIKRRGSGRTVNPADAAIGSSAITSTSPGAQPNTPVPTPESSTTPAAERSIPKSSFEKERDRASLAAQMMEERDPNYVPDSSLPTGGDNDNDDNNNNNGGGGNNNQDTLSNAAIEYIRENFGSVDFFQRKRADEMEIDTNGDGEKDMNIIDYLESTGEQNPDVIWGLFQRTEWFAQNGPSARQFQMDWDKAGGSIDWTPSYDLTSGTWLNTSPDMLELLDDTYDSLTLEANRLGINTDKTETKNAIMAMAYNAKQLNMTDYEIKNEFITGYNGSFNVQNVQGSGTFANIKQQLRQNAATYMIKLDDTTLTDYANKIYLGKATYEGITAGHAQAVMDTEPALKSLVEQGYTPSAYFSTYSNAASQLLGRNVDFLGVDNKMYRHITDSMQNNDGLNRPMTRGEFERYVRATPEWDYSDNARDEAYSTVDTLLNSFGVKV